MLTLQILHPTLQPFLALIFGLCIGSFLNVVILRIPADKSVVRPRSRCPHCDTPIAWHDNIPVVSFILLKRRCRHCQKPISIQYLIVELLAAILSVITIYFFPGLTLYFAYFCLLVAPLLAVIFIDLKHRIIPDVISIPGIAAGVFVHYLAFSPLGEKQALLDSLFGILAGGGFLFLVAFIYEKLKKKEGLGGGDIKLAAMLGAFFGWQGVLVILLLSSVLGTVVGLFVVIFKKNWEYALPFGPFLAVSAYIQLFFGPEILDWYISLYLK